MSPSTWPLSCTSLDAPGAGPKAATNDPSATAEPIAWDAVADSGLAGWPYAGWRR